MNTEISIASINDLPVLAELLNDLFSQDIEFTPNLAKQKMGLEKIINNPEIGEILVIKVDNQILGMVSLLYSISTALGGRVAVLEDMVIDKKPQAKRSWKRIAR